MYTSEYTWDWSDSVYITLGIPSCRHIFLTADNSGKWAKGSSKRLARPQRLSATPSQQGFQFAFCTQLPSPTCSRISRQTVWHAIWELRLSVEWHHKTFASERTSPVLPHQPCPLCCSCYTWWWQTSQGRCSLHFLRLVGTDLTSWRWETLEGKPPMPAMQFFAFSAKSWQNITASKGVKEQHSTGFVWANNRHHVMNWQSRNELTMAKWKPQHFHACVLESSKNTNCNNEKIWVTCFNQLWSCIKKMPVLAKFDE